MVPPPSATSEMQALVDHAAWVRQLARQLVRDTHLADDLAQETCLAALVHRPATDRSLRGWLATVLRNLIRQRRRGDDRRGRREEDSARGEATESTVEVIEKISVHHAVVDAVRALDEPYRSTLLLRYFENLTPSAIGIRTGVPVSTVKTRLARGLDRLRAKLDHEHGGDGRAWLAALVPLIHDAGGPTATIGALAVSTPAKISAAVVLAAGLTYVVATRGPSSAAPPEEAAPAVAAELEPAPREPREATGEGEIAYAPTTASRAALEATPEEPVASALIEPATNELIGRVLDEHARPLAGVPLRLIAYPMPGEVEEGPVGVELPEHQLDGDSRDRVLSGADGSFRFPVEPRAGRVVADGEPYATILAGIAGGGRGSAESIVVVGPRIELAGWVADDRGLPLADAELSVELPEGFRSRFTQVMDFTFDHGARGQSAEDGRFAFEPLAYVEGAELHVHRDGFQSRTLPLPPQGDLQLQVVLARVEATERSLAGTVLDALGVPVEGADVSFGVERTTTDENGRFVFDLDDPDSMNVMGARFGFMAKKLTAVKAGFLPAELELSVDPETGAPPGRHDIELRLGGEALELTGRVVDTDGEPLAGIDVWVKEGSLFAFGQSGRVLESVIAGDPDRTWRFVTTGPTGRFTLDGLADRAYVVAAHDPATLLRVESAPAHPSAGPVTLTLDRSRLWRTVAGHVVTRDGEPLAGVTVSPATDVFLTKLDGRTVGTSHDGVAGATTDADGFFELENVPRELVYLRIGGEDVIADDWGRHVEGGLAALSDGKIEDLEVVAALRMHLKVELTDPTEADEFGALDEDGNEIVLNLIQATSRMEDVRMPILDGRSEVISATDSARTLVLYKDGVEVRRAPLALVRGEVTIVAP